MKFLTIFLSFLMVPAWAQSENLFGDATGLSKETNLRATASTVGMRVERARFVSVRTPLLRNGLLRLNLFAGLEVVAHRTRTTVSADGGTMSWIGQIQGEPESEVILVAAGELVSGSLQRANGEFFQIEARREGISEIRQVVYQELTVADAIPISTAEDPPLRKEENQRAAGASPEIDVMVVYTPAARAAVGSQAVMENKIQLAVTQANQSYLNSGIPLTLRLVHAAEVNYDESAGISLALSRLQMTGDGFLDQVHSWRDQYGADVVSLWIQGPGAGGGTVGLGYIMTSVSSWFAPWAFTVVEQNFALGPSYSFAHEIGHNQGAMHDRANASGQGAYAYAYGYQQTAPAARFRTIMAYACATVNCPKINFWSNPDIQYGGYPTGVASGHADAADNRSTLLNTAATVAAFRPAANLAPVAGTLSPQTGSGLSQTFTAAYDDSNGSGDLETVGLLVNTTAIAAGGCWVEYVRASNTLRLADDTGTGWAGGLTPGSGSVSNSQCTLSGAGSFGVQSGNTLAVSFALTFSPAFRGPKGSYLAATDIAGALTGWQERGSWTVPEVPSSVTVVPPSGSGIQQTFSIQSNDPAGVQNIGALVFLVNSSLSAVSGCLVRYDRPSQTLRLMNDTNTAWVGTSTPGVPGTQQNSQCALNTGLSTASTAGTTLSLNLSLTFSAGFSGAKSQYLQLMSAAGVSSTWQTVGNWIVPSQGNLGVSPSSGSGSAQTFAVTYSDPAGVANLGSLLININAGLVSTNACYVRYDRSANQLRLLNDQNTGWAGAVAPGTPGALQNTQCLLNTGSSSILVSGNLLTLQLAISFTAPYAGARNFYANTVSAAGVEGQWQVLGTWTAEPPSGTQPGATLTPATGSGTRQTFTLAYTDAAGVANIAALMVNFNSVRVSANACYIRYDRAANQLRLLNDQNTGWRGASAPGTGPSQRNSQCVLDLAASSVGTSGNTLTLNLALTFLPGYAGVRTAYLDVLTASGTYLPWQTLGTWTVVAPAQSLITPATGAGRVETFSLLYTSSGGSSQTGPVMLLINSQLSSAHSCYIRYEPSANQLWLLNDQNTGWIAYTTPGSPGIQENNQCRLDVGASSVTSSDSTLVLNLAIQFNPSFTGPRNLYLGSLASNGSGRPWQTLGMWTVN